MSVLPIGIGSQIGANSIYLYIGQRLISVVATNDDLHRLAQFQDARPALAPVQTRNVKIVAID